MANDFVLAWVALQLGTSGQQQQVAVSAPADHPPRHPIKDLVAIAASILADKFDVKLLAGMLEMDVHQLSPYLLALVGEIFVEVCDPSDGYSFVFIDGAARNAAYDSIRAERRAILHRRAADVLITRTKIVSLEMAVCIARHYQAANEWEQAFRWLRTAAERAIIETTADVAADHLRAALALARQHSDAITPTLELTALSLLGPLQAQLNGSGSKEVSDVYARCLDIADGLEDNSGNTSFDVLWGLNACILVHGRVETARELGNRLLRAAQASGNATQVMLATRLNGLGSLLAGEIGPAIGNFTIVGQLYNARRHAPLRFRYASDQAAVALAHKAWAEAIAGQAEASETTSNAALDYAQRLRHPHTSAHVACVLAARAQTLQQRNRAAPLATAGLTLARRHGFPYWEAWAEIILGWHEGERHPEIGVARIEGAIEAYRRTGAGQVLPYAQLLRAGLALAAGDRNYAIAAADAALAVSAAQGVVLFDAEILRTKAQAFCYREETRGLLEAAIATARSQGARLFEARAVQALSAVAT